jgi:hypothetical protein
MLEEHLHRTNIGAAGKFGRVTLWVTKIALAQIFVATGASELIGDRDGGDETIASAWNIYEITISVSSVAQNSA